MTRPNGRPSADRPDSRRGAIGRAALAAAATLVLSGVDAVPGNPFAPVAHAASTPAVVATNRALGRGINIGNTLEAPNEGDWGLTLEAGWFDLIADAGFDSVRIPISWSTHTSGSPPWTIDSSFFERVDWALAQAERTGLHAIVDLHHDREIMRDPRAWRGRFVAMWEQVAERYARAPDSVVFELLNEPQGAFDAEPALWNAFLAEALAVVRRSNPERAVIVGPVGYNGIERLDELALPDDPNLIVSVHYYSPFPFTHQGADWVDYPLPTGTTWNGGTVGLASGVQDWSWDTTATPASGRLGIAYARRYAGLSLHVEDGVDPTRLQLRVSGALDVSVGCSGGGELDFVERLARTNTERGTLVADLSACPADTTRIALMNEGGAGAGFDLHDVRLCSAAGCERLVTSARRAIVDDLGKAAAWGEANGRPMNLGEFGAYSRADLPSRTRWTRTVQSVARDAGLSTHYWEFGAGFGAYDRERARWRRPLLNALLP